MTRRAGASLVSTSMIGSVEGPPTVILHIGEPKTGTTHVQDIVWSNRVGLAAAGLQLAGHSPTDQYRAMSDLRGLEPEPGDPGGSWVGEWDVLAAQARRATRTALISQESIAAVRAEQAERAVHSFGDADVHVVLSVRDFGSLLPAEWQETIKHRRARGWRDWLADIVASEPARGARPSRGFWAVHDTVEVLRVWSRLVPADRLHVVTMPRRSSDPDVLWRRMAGLFGIADLALDTTDARRNSSLGLAETEFLRALNPVLRGRIPNWAYAGNVKRVLAHEVLAERPPTGRPSVPPELDDWVGERADSTITFLRDSGLHVVGDLDELRPTRDAGRTDDVTVTPGDKLDVAVYALAALIERSHTDMYPSEDVVAGTGTQRVLDLARRSPRLTRTVRELSTRPGLGWTRVLAWRVHEAATARDARRSHATSAR